jgi:hypothetical protein
MPTFYEEIEHARAKGQDALIEYERRCLKYARQLVGYIGNALGWPKNQILLADLEEYRPGDARPAMQGGYIDREGYHFGMALSGQDWNITFRWTLRSLPEDRYELKVSTNDPGKNFTINSIIPEALDPVVAYVRQKLREDQRHFTLADLVEGK